MPKIVAEMKRWVDGIEGRVIVVHCKAGKGRSGTMACAFLISERGWAREDAQQRFTARRMRPACGEGVSMPSQVRCLEYTDRWTKGGKLYTERRCRVKEVRLWGLQKGVKVSIKGFDEGGRIVRDYHVFTAEEERVVQDTSGDPHGNLGPVGRPSAAAEQLLQDGNPSGQTPKSPTLTILRPSSPIELPTSDICLLMQSSITPYGISMVTSVAHAWFNIFLEGHGPEQNCRASDEGIFEIGWQSMDGVSSGSYCGLACMEKAVVGWEAGSGLTAASMEEGANTTTSMS